jgi:hypothetical protein
LLFLDVEDFREELDLLAGGFTSQRFDVCQDHTCHVTPQQLQLDDKFVLRPSTLVSRARYIAADNIGIRGHLNLLASWPAVHPVAAPKGAATTLNG